VARSSRRPTFWTAEPLVNSVLVEDADTTLELVPPTELIADREPTLIRVVGHLQIGSTPVDLTTGHVVNLFWGLAIMNVTAGFPSLLTDDGLADERLIYTGLLRSVWTTEPISTTFTDAGVPTGTGGGATNQRGAWEFERFDARAMRRIRDGDSLCLVYFCNTTVGNPTSVDISGFVRALVKER